MKILHLSGAKKVWGGAENHLENLVTELQKLAPEVTSKILCVKNSKFHQKLKATNANFDTAPLKVKVDPRYILKIKKICEEENISMLHIHDPTALTLALLADKISPLPPFILSKKTSFPIKDRKQTIYKYNYPKIKRVLCVSEESGRLVKQRTTDHSKIVTIYHGTRLDNKSAETPFQLRKKLDISDTKKIVGTIGNHSRPKHLETWVETIHELINIKGHKDLHFVQLGDFSERTEDLNRRIREYHLEEYITFLGFTPQASNFLPQFDLLLVTSEIEGIPQVIYEAFYHKVPVVSTDVGGIPETIVHNHNGLLAPKWDSEKLAENIAQLLEQPALIEQFTQRSFQVLMDKFTTEKMAKETLKQYLEVLQEVRADIQVDG